MFKGLEWMPFLLPNQQLQSTHQQLIYTLDMQKVMFVYYIHSVKL